MPGLAIGSMNDCVQNAQSFTESIRNGQGRPGGQCCLESLLAQFCLKRLPSLLAILQCNWMFVPLRCGRIEAFALSE